MQVTRPLKVGHPPARRHDTEPEYERQRGERLDGRGRTVGSNPFAAGPAHGNVECERIQTSQNHERHLELERGVDAEIGGAVDEQQRAREYVYDEPGPD